MSVKGGERKAKARTTVRKAIRDEIRPNVSHGQAGGETVCTHVGEGANRNKETKIGGLIL